MSELSSYIDFLFDFICMIPPLDLPFSLSISKDQAMYFAFGSIFFLALSIVSTNTKKDNPQMTLVFVVVTAISLIIGYMSQPELMKTIFVTSYPPMVVCIRFAELSLVGAGISKKFPIPFIIIAFLLLVILILVGYHYLVPLPSVQIGNIKYVWILFGAVSASITWTRKLSNSNVISGGLAWISCVGLFVSTLLYIFACPPNSIERFLFKWSLPCGFLAGIVFGYIEKNKKTSTP